MPAQLDADHAQTEGQAHGDQHIGAAGQLQLVAQ